MKLLKMMVLYRFQQWANRETDSVLTEALADRTRYLPKSFYTSRLSTYLRATKFQNAESDCASPVGGCAIRKVVEPITP